MLVLSIDTSGQSGGITLAEGDENSCRIIESSPIAGGTFSAQLVPTLAQLLEKHGLTVNKIDGFVAVSGPGSFTGLRVGLSAIKGLAEVLKKPIATVSLLEALVLSAGQSGHVTAAMDARRDEFFFGVFSVTGAGASLLEQELYSRDELLHRLTNQNSLPLITSDESVVELARSVGVQARKVERSGSETVAKIGIRKLLAGETVGVQELDANYIRRAEAENIHDGGTEPRRKTKG